MSNKPIQKNITVDSDRFDPLQMRVLQEIAGDIKSALTAAGLTDDKLREFTETLTFGIAAIVDGSRVMELDGEEVSPVLTFCVDQETDEIIGAEGGSWMHEYAIGVVEELFEGNEDA